MVAHTRAAPGPDRLRPLKEHARPGSRLKPLNLPRNLRVEEEGGKPARLVSNEQKLLVEAIQERWRIDDEWWRRPISRLYFRLLLESGTVVTVFKDLETGQWFEQQY